MVWRSDAGRANRLEIEYGRDVIDGWPLTFGNIGNAGPDSCPIHQLADIGMIVDVIVPVVRNDHIWVSAPNEIHVLDPAWMVEPDIRIFVAQHDQFGTDHISALLRLPGADSLDLRAG